MPPTAPRSGAAATAVTALIVGYILFYGWLCWDKWRYFLYRDFDLAIFAQALDRLLAGSFHGSIRGIAWPGDHSSLVLFLVAPIYAVARSPLTLLALQTVVLALGAVAVHRLAVRTLKAPMAGVAFAAAYLSYPALGYLNLFEFHPEALATTALLFALERLDAGRPRAALLFTGLALSCREDVALVVLGMALMSIVRRPRPWRFAAGLAGLAALSLVLSFGVLRPLFNQGQATYGDMYAAWGPTPIGAARALVADPLAAIQAWFSTLGDPFDSSLKRAFHVHLLLPVLFLPLTSPLALVPMLAIVAEHLWSSRTPQHTIAYQYTALMIPFVFLAAIRGMRNLVDGRRRWAPAVRQAAFVAVAVSSLGSAIAFGPLADVSLFRSVAPREQARPLWADRAQREQRERMLKRLPDSGGVVAGFEFLSRLTRRDGVHALHHVLSGAYTYSTRAYPEPGDVTALIADFGDAQSLAYLTTEGSARLRSLCARNGLRPAMAADDLVLFLRGAADTVALVQRAEAEPRESFPTTFDGRLIYLGCDPVAGRMRAGDVLATRTFWRTEPGDSVPMPLYRLHLGLFDPKGSLWYERYHDLGYGLYPPETWPPGRSMTEPYRLTVPPELPPGHYLLAARVYARRTWRDQALAAAVDSSGQSIAGHILLGEIDVEGAK